MLIMRLFTYFVDLQMSVHFTIRGDLLQTAHDCNKVFGFNLPLSLLVIKRETFFELCIRTRKVQYKPIPHIFLMLMYCHFYLVKEQLVYLLYSWIVKHKHITSVYSLPSIWVCDKNFAWKVFRNSLVENMYCELIKNKCRIEKRMSISPCLHTFQVFRKRVTLWITCRN